MANKYNVIAKVGTEPDGSAKCVKHHTNDLIGYCKMLDDDFPKWTWCNVFSSKTKERLGSFTCKSKPTQKQPF